MIKPNLKEKHQQYVMEIMIEDSDNSAILLYNEAKEIIKKWNSSPKFGNSNK